MDSDRDGEDAYSDDQVMEDDQIHHQDQILSPIVIPCAKLRFRKLQKKVRAAEDSGVVVGTQNYGHKLSQSLYQHQQDGKFCDFSLKLDSGKELSVHKMVLSSTSTYFSGLFDSQMIETSQGFVELKDMKDKPALEMIKFMYTGKLFLSKDNISDMIDSSSRLQVDCALKLCATYLISTIVKGNCVDVYLLADKYSLLKAREAASHYMKSRFTCIPDDQLKLLTLDQITGIVASDSLLCSSEWHVFNKVHDWLKQIEDEEVHRNSTNVLMKLIRFPLMTGEELVSKVSKLDLMRNAECSAILSEAKDYHIVIPTQPVMQTPRTQVRHAGIIHMVMCSDKDFYAHPLLSPYYTLTSESAFDLKKPPRPIIRPNICVYNNFLYACGGVYDRSADAISSARCFRYDPRTDSWIEIASMIEARQRFDLEVVGDYMFALGGWDENVQSSTGEVYSFALNEWKKFMLPHGYHLPSRHATCSVADSIYASGGGLGAYTSKSMVQYVHDKNSNSGTLLVRNLPDMSKQRKKHKMFAHNGRIYVMGGMSSSIEIFDIVTEQWTMYAGFQDSLMQINRIAGVCSLNPNRIVICGYKDSRSTCWVINLDKDPVKEKSQFVKKLAQQPKLSHVESSGCQLWLPAQGLYSSGRTETPPNP